MDAELSLGEDERDELWFKCEVRCGDACGGISAFEIPILNWWSIVKGGGGGSRFELEFDSEGWQMSLVIPKALSGCVTGMAFAFSARKSSKSTYSNCNCITRAR